jgi:hypothetical protein
LNTLDLLLFPPTHGNHWPGNEKTYAQVAQLVEQRTENPRVAGSIPALGTPITPSAQHLVAALPSAVEAPPQNMIRREISLLSKQRNLSEHLSWQ